MTCFTKNTKVWNYEEVQAFFLAYYDLSIHLRISLLNVILCATSRTGEQSVVDCSEKVQTLQADFRVSVVTHFNQCIGIGYIFKGVALPQNSYCPLTVTVL